MGGHNTSVTLILWTVYLTANIMDLHKIPNRLANKIKNLFQRHSVSFSIKPLRILTEHDDESAPIVICVVRNGMDYLDPFLEHHRNIGISNFVFLVNNCDDGTLQYLCSQHDTSVLSSTADYSIYENHFKTYLVKKYASKRWCIFLDIDEFFVYHGYPCKTALLRITQYLDQNNYNAVITQMLDMFSDDSSSPYEIKNQNLFDQTHIKKTSYPEKVKTKNRYPDDIKCGNIQFHTGGIRLKLFGTDNGLTKVSFFKLTNRLEVFHGWHHCKNANYADISLGLLHYPFSRSFKNKVCDAVLQSRYGGPTKGEYEKYHSTISKTSEIDFSVLTSEELTDIQTLYRNNFLYISSNYTNYLLDTQKAATTKYPTTSQGTS